MIIKIDDISAFVSDFLTPISRVSDTCILKVSKSKFTSIVVTNDNSLILYATYNQEQQDDVNSTLNVTDVSKLIKILGCIDKGNIEINLDQNNLSYESRDMSFKYHLLADNILQEPGIDINKIKSLDFDFSFSVSYNSIMTLIKGSTFATDTNKIYVSTRDGCVYGELTDTQKQNIDTYTQKLSDSYTGSELPASVPVNFELIRHSSSIKTPHVNIKMCTENKIFLFNTQHGQSIITYIASAFVN